MCQALKRTSLYQWHIAHGARMIPFAGWEMPVQYLTGPIEEHHATRRSVGLFDIDHMGQISIHGPDAQRYLNHIVTWDISQMKLNEVHYALMCYEHGGTVDDVLVFRLPGQWLVVVNAANLTKDYQWMLGHAADYDVEIEDVSIDTYMMAVQGPRTIELLQHITESDLAVLSRFSMVRTRVAEVSTLVSRTGYTGEDGVELFFPAEHALEVWTAILAAGEAHDVEVKPIGLAARDSLRFEPGFPLYEHEIGETITPLEANLAWACSFHRDFIGKKALVRQRKTGLTRKLISFEMLDRGVPRQGYILTTVEDQPIGSVVTGLYAPTVDRFCGNAFVPPDSAAPGTELLVIIRGKPKAIAVAKRPFHKPAYR